ncbi:MAG: hypothetical protein O7D94_07930 [Planctomycetota bacterium]|nr:hypothetical protein [Planctomycetota bacterium]
MRNRFGMTRAATGVFSVFAVVILAVGACQTDVPLPAPPSGNAVSFSGDIQPIFNASCIDCHSAGGFADIQGIALRLTAGESFNGLVNQPSSQQADLTLVVPGDSASSLLFQKVSSNTPPIGSTMPLIGGPLSAVQSGLIRDWIDQGAMNN